MYRAQVGYLTRSTAKTTGESDGKRDLLDVTAGMTMGDLSVDIEFASLKDDAKNTLTGANDSEDPGTGVFALVTYKLMDGLTLGVRYETTDKITVADTNFATATKGDSYGAAVHYKLTPEVETRAEYIGYTYKTLADVSATASRFNVAALYRF